MKIEPTISGARDALLELPRPRVLVPTMGALHEGHRRLLDCGRDLAGGGGSLTASIFVNPTQFGPGEDLESYPRTLEADAEICRGAGVDVIFAPVPGEVYAPDASISVTEESLSLLLCGETRPGHFAGVCLVVLKLFNIIGPDIAVFGKKDYQQLAIIRRMVRDLDLQVEIVGAETVREDDGLAMSSRNAYLTPIERAQAPGLRRALLAAKAAFDAGEARGSSLLSIVTDVIATEVPDGRIDYLDLVDSRTIGRIDQVPEGGGLIALAVHLGKARLIDNIELD